MSTEIKIKLLKWKMMQSSFSVFKKKTCTSTNGLKDLQKVGKCPEMGFLDRGTDKGCFLFCFFHAATEGISGHKAKKTVKTRKINLVVKR